MTIDNRLNNASQCPNCGAEIYVKSRKLSCWHCGYEETLEHKSDSNLKKIQETKARKKRVTFGVWSTAVLVALLAILWEYCK